MVYTFINLLFNLPTELILLITEYLPPESFIAFAFAEWRFLGYRDRNLVPPITLPLLNQLKYGPPHPSRFHRLPAELILQILAHLRPADVLRLVLANYHVLRSKGIAPRLTGETWRELRMAAYVPQSGALD